MIDARRAWAEPLCGLPMVRRHVRLAERIAASPITVVCHAAELAEVAGRLAGTRARVTAEAVSATRHPPTANNARRGITVSCGR